MRGPHNIIRLVRTGATFERTGAMRHVLEAMGAPARIRLAARLIGLPFRWLGYRGDPALPPLVRALTALGPAYVKFGQLLSTRPDIVGPELAAELRMLQDRMPPFPMAEAEAEIERSLGRPVSEVFESLSAPVAAASIAQVHKGRLREDGTEVAVKVLRPDIERDFRRDIDAFHFAAGAIEFLLPASRRLRPSEVIDHFESVVENELDLRLEAAAASEYGENTDGDAGFHVPRVLWQLTDRRVLTLEWVDGTPLGDPEALRAAGHDLPALARTVLQSFLTHALRDGFFHADMHQGNLMVAEDGRLVAVDFGIMGRLDEYTRRIYAEILLGFIRRDYRRVAEVHFEAGYVPADRDLDAFTLAIRTIGEPIFGMDARRISMARLLALLFEVTERFGMQTRTELILLQRTMVVVEGVARSLDPEINIWEVARPVVESYIRENIGPKAALRDLNRTLLVLARFGPRLPGFAEKALHEMEARSRRDAVRESRLRPWLWAGGGAAAAAIIMALLA